MSEWPKLDELKQVLNADPESNAWDGETDNTRLTGLLASGIAYVKGQVGEWNDATDVPTASLSRAALRAAQLMAPPINRAPDSLGRDPILAGHMTGHRRRFAIS